MVLRIANVSVDGAGNGVGSLFVEGDRRRLCLALRNRSVFCMLLLAPVVPLSHRRVGISAIVLGRAGLRKRGIMLERGTVRCKGGRGEIRNSLTWMALSRGVSRARWDNDIALLQAVMAHTALQTDCVVTLLEISDPADAHSQNLCISQRSDLSAILRSRPPGYPPSGARSSGSRHGFPRDFAAMSASSRTASRRSVEAALAARPELRG